MSNKTSDTVFDRRRAHEIKLSAVIDFASDLFNRKGYAATSLDEIANHFNVSKPTLYYYVKSKPNLLKLCYEKGFELCEEVMDNVLASDQTGLQKLKNYHIEIGKVRNQCPICVVQEYTSLPEDAIEEIQDRARIMDHKFTKIVEMGVEDGSIGNVPPRLTALLVMGAFSWTARWYSESGPLSIEEIFDLLTSIIIDGLKAKDGARKP